MLEDSATMPRRHFDHGWEVIYFVTIHGPHYRDLVNHRPNVRKPIRNRNARPAVAGESTPTGNHRSSHLSLIVPKTDGIDQLSGPLVVFRIERVNVANAAAHE